MKLNLHKSLPGIFPATSSIDWCEPNYIHSTYIAELFNTLSNLYYILFSVLFLYLLRTKVHVNHIKNRLISYSLSVCLVGVGSWMFHCTLTREGQMFDEIAMFIAFLPPLFALFNMDDYKRSEERVWLFRDMQAARSAAMIAALFVFIVYQYEYESTLLFQSMFGCCMFYTLFHAIYLVRRRAHLRSSDRECQQHHANKKKLLLFWLTSVLTGFSCWLIDNNFCERLEFIEGLKLHSLWHLFTGFGTYVWGAFILYAYYIDQMDEYGYELKQASIEKRQVAKWTENVTPSKVKLEWSLFLVPIISITPLRSD